MFCKRLVWRGECLHILLVVKIIFYLDQPCPALAIFNEVSKCNYANGCWLWLGGKKSFPPSLQCFPQPFPAKIRSAFPFYVLQPLQAKPVPPSPLPWGEKMCLNRSPGIWNCLKSFDSWHWKLEIIPTADTALAVAVADVLCDNVS